MGIPFIDLKTQYQALKDMVDHNIQTVLDHGQFIMGPEVTTCEQQLAEFTGAQHAITVASGTDAALLALMALEIGPGDEVITTAFSFIATAEVIVLLGATPVFVDIDPETYNIAPEKVKAAITSNTKAIMPVSLYGQPADMDELNQIAKENNLWVIEDAAQSFGAEYKGKKSNNLSSFGVTSFFPAKPLGCYGDGGAVFTNDERLADRVRERRNHGSKERYQHTSIGLNGRMDTLQAAILLAKLERYPWEVDQRQKIGQRYTENIQSAVGDTVTTPVVRPDRTSVWAQYTVRVKDRPDVQSRLKELGVPTAVHYPNTMPDQPAYQNVGVIWDCPESQKAAQEVMSLPMHPDLSPDVQDEIIEALTKAVKS